MRRLLLAALFSIAIGAVADAQFNTTNSFGNASGFSVAIAPAGGGSCTPNSYGWSGVQTDTAFTVPANCTLMFDFAIGGGAAGATGTLAQGGNGGGSGGLSESITSVTAGATIYITISSSITRIASGTGGSGTVYLLANAASGATGGTTGSCSSNPCTLLAGANGGTAGSVSYGGAGGAGAPGSFGAALAGGATTATDYGGGGGGGSNGPPGATTPATATTSGHTGGQGAAGTGAGTGGGSSGTHPGGNATANSGGGGQGGYGSNGNTSGTGGTGALYSGIYVTTASAAGTVASSTPIDGGGGGGGSGGASSGSAIAAGGAGGGCGGGGGGSGGNISVSGTNAGGGAGAAGCVFASFSNTDPTTCAQATTYFASATGVSGSHKTNQQNMICGLVADGTWSALLGFYILATDTAADATVNAVSPGTYDVNSIAGCTFAAYTGASYCSPIPSTQFTPSTNGGTTMTQNSTNFGACNLTSGVTGDTLMGADDGTRYSHLKLNTSAGSDDDVNAANFPTVTYTTSLGTFLLNRTISTGFTAYQNGSSLGAKASTSTGLPTSPMYLGSSTSGGSWSSIVMGVAFFGGGLNAWQVTSISSRISTFMTAEGNSGC